MPTDHWPFALLALLTLASAIAAMTLRNLVHCALMLMLTLAGLAGLYLELGAQFVGFAQVLVYVGAVAILIVFAILLTRGSEPPQESRFSATWLVGAAVAVAAGGLLSAAILASKALGALGRSKQEVSVKQIGEALMGKFVLPLEVLGLLLTAALIGAVLIALQEEEKK